MIMTVKLTYVTYLLINAKNPVVAECEPDEQKHAEYHLRESR